MADATVATPITIVCISDTHGLHRTMNIPKGDILIHAGDFSKFGNMEHITDFNEWLGTLPHKYKIVVNGNHDQKAVRPPLSMETILSNAKFLKQSSVQVEGLLIFGTDFFWPCPTGNPYFEQIPNGVDIVISHGPASGYVDNNGGCPSLLEFVQKRKPQLFVCGHMHGAHGTAPGTGDLQGTTFVNAANCKDGYQIGWDPIVVTVTPRKQQGSTQ